jgi:hypothetical protein
MRKGLLGSVAALAASAGLAFGQAPQGRAVDPPASVAPTPLVPGQAGPSSGQLPLAPLPPGVSPNAMPPGPDGYGPNGLFNSAGQQPDCGYYLERLWFNIDYILWHMRSEPSAWPLAVQGTVANGVNPFAPGSVTLFGGTPVDWDLSNGARIEFGGWLPGSTKIGIDVTGTITEAKTLTRSAASGPLGIPVLGAPFINELTGTIDSLFASTPGIPGAIAASAKTQLWSTDVDVVGNVYRAQYFTANVIAGFSYFSLQEGMSLQLASTGNPSGFFLGAVNASPTSLLDQFNTRNNLYGGNIGAQFEYRYRRFTLDLEDRLVMGVVNQFLDVNGYSQAGGMRVPGGLFTQTTNIGQRSTDEFGVVPQLHAELGYQATKWLRVNCGIDFLYASSMLRPGNQIDNVVNPTIMPFNPAFGTVGGTARPAQLFVVSDFYALGVSFGMQVRY